MNMNKLTQILNTYSLNPQAYTTYTSHEQVCTHAYVNA